MALRIYRKSESGLSLKSYVERVQYFTTWLKLSPDVALKSNLDWEGVLNDYIDHLNIERRLSGNTINISITAVKK